MGRVIVGVDGSDASWNALAFAAEEAHMRGAVLQVVHVLKTSTLRGAPVQPTTPPGIGFASAGMDESLLPRDSDDWEAAEHNARRQGEDLINDMLDSIDVDEVQVDKTLLFDHRPARRLTELADADDVELLVIGSRGHGELTGLLLGSVSQACATHASVPVTVVHAPKR